MRLTLPKWVHHDDKPIFAIDIHPRGDRFAIGGLGSDSGRISVSCNHSDLASTKCNAFIFRFGAYRQF